MNDKELKNFYSKITRFIDNYELQKIIDSLIFRFSLEDFYIDDNNLIVNKDINQKLSISLKDSFLSLKYIYKGSTQEITADNEKFIIVKTKYLKNKYVRSDEYIYDRQGNQMMKNTWIKNFKEKPSKLEIIRLYLDGETYNYINEEAYSGKNFINFYKNIYKPTKLSNLNFDSEEKISLKYDEITSKEFLEKLEKLKMQSKVFVKCNK